jgi:electron transfer flavoprotein alpha subunit
MPISTVWVLAEANESGAPTPTTLELLTKARDLAGEVVAVGWGESGAGLAGPVGEHGATKLLHVADLGDGLPGPAVAGAMAERIAAGGPDVILFPQSYDGRDIAARLSARLDKPVLTNVVELSGGDSPESCHAVFGGAKIVKARFTTDGPHLFLVRPKSFAPEASGGGAAEVETLSVPDLGRNGAAKVTERHIEERTGPKLDEAGVVVSGGRGLGEADKFELIETLAKLLKGAAGASRAIVDAGWVPYSYQVGQTGKTVKPSVYVACGISGATQHMVGMKGAKNIIAINKDDSAPIFSVADLGIVADVHKVLPKLIEALQSRG